MENYFELAETLCNMYGDEKMCEIIGALSDKDLKAFFE